MFENKEKILKSETWTLVDEATLNYVFLSTSYAELKSIYEEIQSLIKAKGLKPYDTRLKKFYDLLHKTTTLIRRLWLLIGENIKDNKTKNEVEIIEKFVWEAQEKNPDKQMKKIDEVMRILTKLLAKKKLINVSSTVGKFKTSKRDMAI